MNIKTKISRFIEDYYELIYCELIWGLISILVPIIIFISLQSVGILH